MEDHRYAQHFLLQQISTNMYVICISAAESTTLTEQTCHVSAA